mgnify:CR=1 FL=1
MNAELSSEISVKKRIIFTALLFLLPLLLILLFEAALELFQYGGDQDLFVEQTSGEISEFVLNENFTKRYFFQKGIKTPVPLSQRFPAEKSGNTFRVFCLGASTTQGFPYPPNAAFPAILQNILTSIFPDKNIEVLNCGITAITSYSVLDMQREILKKYQPDLIIIYTGHNEFYGVFGQASTLSLFKNRMLLQLFLKMQRSKIFLLMRDAIHAVFGKQIEPDHPNQPRTLMRIMAQDIGIRQQSKVYERTKKHYKDNLEAMCRLAEKHQTDLMLCTLVDNQKDLPPFASQHDVNFADQDSATWHSLIQEARIFRDAGQYQNAIDKYRQAIAIDSTFALTHFELGHAYYALENYADAQTHFVLAKDYDPIRFRAPSSFNAILAEVSGHYDVPLVDIQKSFANQSPAGIPGQNLLHEHVHPNLRGYLLIAQTLAKGMSENAFMSESWDWTRTKSDSQYIALCQLTDLDHEVVNYTLYRLTSQWPFPPKSSEEKYERIGNAQTEALAKSLVDGGDKSLVELHLEYGAEFHQNNELDRALEEYKAALAMHPLALTYNRLGRIYLRKTEIAFRDQDDYAAASVYYRQGITYFKEGLQRWPDDIELNYNLGLLLFMRNDQMDLAVEQFQKVLQVEPDHKNAHFQLAALYIRQNDYTLAKTLLQQAITRFPQEARFYTELGFVHMQEKNYKEAERLFTLAIQTNDDPKAQYFLNQLRAARQ